MRQTPNESPNNFNDTLNSIYITDPDSLRHVRERIGPDNHPIIDWLSIRHSIHLIQHNVEQTLHHLHVAFGIPERRGAQEARLDSVRLLPIYVSLGGLPPSTQVTTEA